MNIRRPFIAPQLPMKDMDGAMLTVALLDELSDLPEQDYETFKNALWLAAYLHRTTARKNATRATSGHQNQPTSPYIQHPLRNTLRLVRWGVRDVNTLVASLLHDTVEDCAEEIVQEFTDLDTDVLTESGLRTAALDYLSRAFNSEAARIVNSVSNPFHYGAPQSRVQKNEAYVSHVREEVMVNPKVFLVKVSDYADNALSLRHHIIDEGAKRRAVKYLPLAAIFLEALDAVPVADYTDIKGFKDIRKRLEGATAYLNDVINTDISA